jgi:hypothetical protein
VLDRLSGVGHAEKPVRIQTLVAELPVEALHVRILRRLEPGEGRAGDSPPHAPAVFGEVLH